jgi:hypothetical protein
MTQEEYHEEMNRAMPTPMELLLRKVDFEEHLSVEDLMEVNNYFYNQITSAFVAGYEEKRGDAVAEELADIYFADLYGNSLLIKK